MDYFNYRNGRLFCEEVSLEDLAGRFGTPLYVYSHRTIARHYNAYADAFGRENHILCYAVKANTNGAILRSLARLGSGADVVSGGELYRALAAGIPPGKIVYAGVGKDRSEIEYALKSGILMFNVESSQELEYISKVAEELGLSAPVALRINPAVDPNIHAYIATGLEKSKFGIDHGRVLEHYHLASQLPAVEIKGIHMHIGSQITELSPFKEALEKMAALMDSLGESGLPLEYLDIGGGLGIDYGEGEAPLPGELAATLRPILDRLGRTLITEPGRALMGNAGILVCRVLYTKTTPVKHFIITDGGMNDLIRPSLYSSYHEIQPVEEKERPMVTADVVGPVCESGDFFALDRELPAMKPGELMVVRGAGAYGFSMASNYNSRPRSAEVMVRDDEAFLVRKRETYEDLIELEGIPPWLD
jgi:diaminopimelate decarboxylase